MDDAEEVQVPVWAYVPRRRPREINDVFFLEGNAVRSANFRRPGVLALTDWQDDPSSSIVCGAGGCHTVLPNAYAYELHFNASHRNVCRFCRRVMLSARLLDLHVLETHDTLFKVLAEKEKMYACLVEGCDRKFFTPDKRRLHLVDTHKFPKSYRFEQPPGKKKQSQQAPNSSFPSSISFGRGARKGFHPSGRSKPSAPAPSPQQPQPAGPNRRERRQRAREEASSATNTSIDANTIMQEQPPMAEHTNVDDNCMDES